MFYVYIPSRAGNTYVCDWTFEATEHNFFKIFYKVFFIVFRISMKSLRDVSHFFSQEGHDDIEITIKSTRPQIVNILNSFCSLDCIIYSIAFYTFIVI